MLLLPLLIVLSGVSVRIGAWKGPGRFTHEDEANRWQHRHLVNMTENICKDAMYKLRQADLVQTAYKHTIGYELGMLACGIMEKFRHMVRMYRYYSNPKKFKDHAHTIEQILNAYSVLQSDYSELIAEIVLYYEVLEEHRKTQQAQILKARIYAKKHGMSVKAVLDLMNKGIDLEQLQGSHLRRSMQLDPPTYDQELEEKELLKELNKSDNFEQQLSKLAEELKTSENMEQEFIKFDEELKTAGSKEQGFSKFQKEPKRSGRNLFAKKNKNNEEAEYKKKLRYIMWAEKWDGYNPATEGVHIDDTIARLGFNESDFLLKELRGDV